MSLQKRIIIDTDSLPSHSHSPRNPVTLSFPENSEYTKQEFRDECDINVIMAQYQYSGEIPNLNTREAVFTDCTGLDYMEHMNKIVEANNLFGELPSKIRNRFNNDPAAFLDFVHNEENRDELQKMGLLKPVSPIVPAPVSEPDTVG